MTKTAPLCLFLLISCLLPSTSHAAPPPVITVQPLDQTVLNGGTVIFTVIATSGTALSYQWYFNGTQISGATSSILTLINVQTSAAGPYYCAVKNSGGTVNTRTATLTVSSLTVVSNTPPVANNDAYTTTEDVALVVPAAGVLTNDTDVDGQALTAVLMTNATQGSVTLNASGAFTYTPKTNFSGTDSFTYRAADGYSVLLEQNDSSGTSIILNDGKIGSQSFRHGTAGGSNYMISQVMLYLSRRSSATANLIFSLGSGVSGGTISGSSKTIAATIITNTSEGSSFQAYVINYAAPVGPFTAGATYYMALNNASGDKVYFESPGGDTYTNGTYYNDGNNQNKDVRFQTYETVPSNPATVTINVLPANDPPTAINDISNTLEDTSVTIKVLANDYDPEGATLTLTGVSTTNGTALISGTNIIFTPATNFNGTAGLNYTISDGSLASTGRVTVTVTAVNDAPIANSDAYICPEDMTLTIPSVTPLAAVTPSAGILVNDTDVDGDALTVVLVNNVTHGTLTLNADSSFSYTPDADYNGPDSFTYRATDGLVMGNAATVAINVTPVSDPLRFTSQQMTANGFELHVAGDAAAYVISASSNLQDWTPIFTNAAPTGSMVYTDTAAHNYSSRFYRVAGQ